MEWPSGHVWERGFEQGRRDSILHLRASMPYKNPPFMIRTPYSVVIIESVFHTIDDIRIPYLPSTLYRVPSPAYGGRKLVNLLYGAVGRYLSTEYN